MEQAAGSRSGQAAVHRSEEPPYRRGAGTRGERAVAALLERACRHFCWQGGETGRTLEELVHTIKSVDAKAWAVQERLAAIGEATFGLAKPERKPGKPPDREAAKAKKSEAQRQLID